MSLRPMNNKQPKDSREVRKRVRKAGGHVTSQGKGSHCTAHVNGHDITFPEGEFKPGLRAGLRKALTAAGVIILLTSCAGAYIYFYCFMMVTP